MGVPNFIEIDAKADKELLIKTYEAAADTVLQPAQDAMIMINLIAYYGNLIKTQINEAAKLNLAEYSRYPILDFLGKYKNCVRISASKGQDTLKITLNTTFSYDITIAKGFQVKTSDGAYIFETTEDLIIAAGENEGEVTIESQEAASAVNDYGAGEINTVISSAFSFIDKVENLNGVSGGSEDETDESYIERILLAPEGYSTAGPELAYIYFAKSAHSSIVDVKVEIPQDDIEIDIDGETLVMSENEAEGNTFSAVCSYEEGTAQITLNQDISSGALITVKVPHPYKIIVYVLTDDSKTSDTVLESVETALKDVRPLCDYVEVQSASREEYEISGTVYLTSDADEDTVTENVQTALNNYLESVKNSLNKSIVLNKITTAVCSIDGVYDFEPSAPENDLEAQVNVCYSGSIGTITYIRTDYN